MFIFRPHIFYNPAGKIIASIALFNLIDSVAKMFGRNALENSSVSFGCNLQAFIIQHISHSIWLLELVLALYLVLIIILEQRIRDIKSMESTAISLAIILPLPLCIFVFNKRFICSLGFLMENYLWSEMLIFGVGSIIHIQSINYGWE
jgi:uncharacterized protein with PQ loop repeat